MLFQKRLPLCINNLLKKSERKGRLETGLKLTNTVWLRPGFLIICCTTACLEFAGTAPEDKLRLMMARTDWPILGKSWWGCHEKPFEMLSSCQVILLIHICTLVTLQSHNTTASLMVWSRGQTWSRFLSDFTRAKGKPFCHRVDITATIQLKL